MLVLDLNEVEQKLLGAILIRIKVDIDKTGDDGWELYDGNETVLKSKEFETILDKVWYSIS